MNKTILLLLSAIAGFLIGYAANALANFDGTPITILPVITIGVMSVVLTFEYLVVTGLRNNPIAWRVQIAAISYFAAIIYFRPCATQNATSQTGGMKLYKCLLPKPKNQKKGKFLLLRLVVSWKPGIYCQCRRHRGKHELYRQTINHL